MPTLTLTDRTVKSLHVSTRTTFFDAKTGVALRVTPSGAKTWVTFYRANGRPRMLTHGTYPALTLADARELHQESYRQVRKEGIDPALQKQQARHVFTVEDLWGVYLEQHAKRKKKRWKDDVWRYQKYLATPWGRRAVTEISRSDVHTLLDKIVAAGKPVQANRVMRLISKVWNVGIDRSHVDVNPCARMALPSKERKRHQVASDDDLRRLWAGLDANPGMAADALRVRLLTAQRGDEVHGMRWEDVNLSTGWWVIPETNDLEQRVPLTPRVVRLLQDRQAAQADDESRVFPKLYHQHKDLRALAVLHGGKYRWHDLRRVVSSRLAEMGWSSEHRGALLNHARRGVTETTYNAYRFDREKRAMLDAWDRELSRILRNEPQTGADVVPLTRR